MWYFTFLNCWNICTTPSTMQFFPHFPDFFYATIRKLPAKIYQPIRPKLTTETGPAAATFTAGEKLSTAACMRPVARIVYKSSSPGKARFMHARRTPDPGAFSQLFTRSYFWCILAHFFSAQHSRDPKRAGYVMKLATSDTLFAFFFTAKPNANTVANPYARVSSHANQYFTNFCPQNPKPRSG